MSKWILFIAFLILSFVACNGSTGIEQKITGSWKLVEIVSEEKEHDFEIPEYEILPPRADNEDFDKDEFRKQQAENRLKDNGFVFYEDHTVDVWGHGMSNKINYRIKNDSIIDLGQKKYKIVLIEDNSMVLKDKNPLSKNSYHYKRVDFLFPRIKDEEKIEEFYPNGIPKSMGKKCKGVRCGVWVDWHPNGVIQSVAHYRKDQQPVMIIQFDEEGMVKSKLWYDLENKEYIQKSYE